MSQQLNKRMSLALLIILFILNSAQTTQLDTLNVLFPEVQHSIAVPHQLITADSGCFIWSSSATDVLSVISHNRKNDACSRHGLVQLSHIGEYSSSVYVTANDPKTEEILTIPVRIRKLNKISIITKSRMMNIREVQKIQISSEDIEGNTFTTLQGLRFEWSFVQNYTIIEKIKISKSQLLLPLNTRINIQNSGFQSDILVVKALAPGNLIIKVRCIEKGYEKLQDQITLSVHQRFEIEPSPILRLISGSSFQLNLITPTLQRISLPKQYYQSSTGSNCHINSSLFLTTPISEIKTFIKVEDIRTKPPFYSQIQVETYDPDEIVIDIHDYLIVGIPTEFKVKLYYKKQELKGISSNIQIKSNFQILNNSQILSSNKAIGKISAKFKNLIVEKQLISIMPLKALYSGKLILPLGQTFNLKVIGGSSKYAYIIDDSNIATINAHGQILTNKIGSAIITVFDQKIQQNKISINLKVSSLHSASSIQKLKQLNVNEFGTIYFVAKNSDQETFTQCYKTKSLLTLNKLHHEIDKKINIKTALKELTKIKREDKIVSEVLDQTSLLKNKQLEIISSFYDYIQSKDIQSQELSDYIFELQNYGICDIVRLRIKERYDSETQFYLTNKHQEIKSVFNVRVYQNIQNTLNFNADQILMTPLSSLRWTYTGGSYSWPKQQTIFSLNGTLISDKFPIINCPKQQKDQIRLNLLIKNSQTQRLLFPVSQSKQLNIACKYPKKLTLLLAKQQSNTEKLFINSQTLIEGQVIPVDDRGYDYYNCSNLQYKAKSLFGTITNEQNKFKYSSILDNGVDRIEIHTNNIKNIQLSFEDVFASFQVEIVKPLALEHLLSKYMTNSTITTLYSPQKSYLIYLKQGSSNINLLCSGVISCSYIRKQKMIQVKLQAIGNGALSVTDNDIYSARQTKIYFNVVDVSSLQIVLSKNNVQEGEQFTATVNYIYNQNILNPILYDQNEIKLIHMDQIQIISQKKNQFVLRALRSGIYDLRGEKRNLRGSIVSQKQILNVYAKLKANINFKKEVDSSSNIDVGEIKLIKGCNQILSFRGGPKGLKINNNYTGSQVQIKQNGLDLTFKGKKLGSTTMFLFFTFNAEEIKAFKLLFTVSSIQVPSLISLSHPIVGSQFRILPIYKISNFQIDQCKCDFIYEWKLSKNNILINTFQTYDYISGSGVNATALSSGSTNITLTIRQRQSKSILAQIGKEIIIVQNIQFKTSSFIHHQNLDSQSLLLPPQSQVEIRDIAPNIKFVQEVATGILQISQNKIKASKTIGPSLLKLIGQNKITTSHIAVQIKPISALFIQNFGKVLQVEVNKKSKTRIYMLDEYGRVFFEKLKNINVLIDVQDQQRIKATIENGYLIISGLNQGSTLLTITSQKGKVLDKIPVVVYLNKKQERQEGQIKIVPFENLILTKSNYSSQININTEKPFVIAHYDGRKQWVKSQFDSIDQVQTIIINMKDVRQSKVWKLKITSQNQIKSQQLQIKYYNNQESHHNNNSGFFKSLEWPDYLIVFMAIIFILVYITQFHLDSKMKRN